MPFVPVVPGTPTPSRRNQVSIVKVDRWSAAGSPKDHVGVPALPSFNARSGGTVVEVVDVLVVVVATVLVVDVLLVVVVDVVLVVVEVVAIVVDVVVVSRSWSCSRSCGARRGAGRAVEVVVVVGESCWSTCSPHGRGRRFRRRGGRRLVASSSRSSRWS
jgi:hypothetical protein